MKSYWIIPNRRIRIRSRLGASGFFKSLAYCMDPQFKGTGYLQTTFDGTIDRSASTFQFHPRAHIWWRYYTMVVGRGYFDSRTRELTVEFMMEWPVFQVFRDSVAAAILGWSAFSALSAVLGSDLGVSALPIIILLFLMPLLPFGLTHLNFHFGAKDAEKFIRFVARLPAQTSPNSM